MKQGEITQIAFALPACPNCSTSRHVGFQGLITDAPISVQYEDIQRNRRRKFAAARYFCDTCHTHFDLVLQNELETA